MAEVRAFAGLRYNAEKVRLDDVVAPPYDVISPREKDELKVRSPYNVVRLILPDDARPGGDRYTEAGGLLGEWRQEQVLRSDPGAAVYVCRQRFTLGGVVRERVGVIAAVKLERFGEGSIFPHESTLSGPKADRMKLLVATRTNLSAVFSIFGDQDGEVREVLGRVLKGPATFGVREKSGECEVWVVTDGEVIGRLTKLMAGRRLFIADGHHRYETALSYVEELRSKTRLGGRTGRGVPAAEHIMMFCVAMEDPGLAILPTHRLIRAGVGPGLKELVAGLGEDFEVKPVTGEADDVLIGGDSPGRFVLYAGKGRAWRVELRRGFDLKRVDATQSEDWCRLDVAVLQKRVLERLLGLTLEKLTGTDLVGYSHDAKETMELVDGGQYASAWLVRPTPVEAVTAVAGRLEKMPPKSTYFYPKALSGLVLRPLVGGF